jgi:hypothetical protein
VGQAFQLGRYPIHFHLIGSVTQSYIRGNAIHQSFNRACTIHGVSYLRIIQNVAYNVMGHTFFIEDAVETENYLDGNLAILTRRSFSLLNSDQTPASFWITNPNNIFRNNHAAGSDNYGYWFDTKKNPTGPSYDPNVCPEYTKLGEFSNNVAHSNGRYGLRIFHKLIPLTYPCAGVMYNASNPTNPYHNNPPITAHFVNMTSWKNQRNGAIVNEVGAICLENFKVADNLLAGIEFELADAHIVGYANVCSALVIGHSENADEMTRRSTTLQGIIGARTEGLTFNNISFYNFDLEGYSCIGSCSHCFAEPSTDSGARTTHFRNLYFDPATTPIKIRYTIPFRDIFRDIDGSLTGLGPESWATPWYSHNLQPECQGYIEELNGIICNSSVQIRRVVFYNYLPALLNMQPMHLLKIDDAILSPMDNVTKKMYYGDTNNYSPVKWRIKTRPGHSWAFPVVTGHKYKLHWGPGLDWTRMQMDISPLWVPSDLDTYFTINFTDVRA